MFETTDPTRALIFTFIFLALVVLIFLACRAVALWYWKIDERLKVMQAQLLHTKRMETALHTQTLLLQMLADNSLSNKRIAIKDNATGNMKYVTLAQFLNVYQQSSGGLSYEIVDKGN